jgi:ribosomal protein S12 methylthiotransferase accessory factor
VQTVKNALGKIRLHPLPGDLLAKLETSTLSPVFEFADFRLVCLDDCPAAFCAGFPKVSEISKSWRTAWRLAGGRGLNEESALFGCAGEVAERLSLLSRGDADPLVTISGHEPLDANAFLMFSANQQADLVARHPSLFEALTPEGIAWSRLSGRSVEVVNMAASSRHAVPSFCVLLNEDGYFGVHGELIGSSAGAASHPDPMTARRNAMLELAEHDAVGIWWFNRLPGLPIALDVLKPNAEELWRWLTARVRQSLLVRLPTDLPVHVIAAVSATPDGEWVAYGFCARLDIAEAAEGAALEMLQCEVSLSAMGRRVESRTDGDRDAPALLQWSERSRLDAVVRAGPRASWPLTEIGCRIEPDSFDRAMKECGTFLADITRSEIGIPVCRAISDTLRDWRPRFASGRLYEAPVTLGITTHELTEENLNEDRILI